MLHTILHLHYTQLLYGNYFSLRVILSGNKAHETHSWVTRPKCFGELILANLLNVKTAENYPKIFV